MKTRLDTRGTWRRGPPRTVGRFAVLLVFFCAGGAAVSWTAPAVISDNGMAVSIEVNATEVGVEILEGGGNAFDAAVAMGFALAVTYPAAGNLGGGGFCVGLEADGSTFAIDFREQAPGRAHRDMFLDGNGEVVRGRSTDTHWSVGVPGTTDGLLLLLRKYGTMTREHVLASAIRLARDGFPLTRQPSDRLRRNPAAARLFFPNGKRLKVGDSLIQPELAGTLSRIFEQGRDGFYKGAVADSIVAEMERHGGLITRKDLRDYRAKEREPFLFRSGNYELVTMTVPSSGGITIAQILGLLDLPKLKAAGWQSAQYVHMLTEAERLAYADRNYFLGDPGYADVPFETLTSPAYLATRRELLPKARAGKSEGVNHGVVESDETTHFTVADQWGNVVAITYTLNSSFGSGILVEGAGFLLNNQMDNFSAKPGVPNNYGLIGADANAIAAGKRMLSSMTPTIVLKNGEFSFTMGSPGGSTIITTVLQIYLNMTVNGMDLQHAIDAPRVHHQWLPDTIQPEENALTSDVVRELKAMGYTLRNRRSIGRAAGIARLKNGQLSGHADRRSTGVAKGH